MEKLFIFLMLMIVEDYHLVEGLPQVIVLLLE